MDLLLDQLQKRTARCEAIASALGYYLEVGRVEICRVNMCYADERMVMR